MDENYGKLTVKIQVIAISAMLGCVIAGPVIGGVLSGLVGILIGLFGGFILGVVVSAMILSFFLEQDEGGKPKVRESSLLKIRKLTGLLKIVRIDWSSAVPAMAGAMLGGSIGVLLRVPSLTLLGAWAGALGGAAFHNKIFRGKGKSALRPTTASRFAFIMAVIFDLGFAAYVVVYESFAKPLLLGINFTGSQASIINPLLSLAVLAAVILEIYGIWTITRSMRLGQYGAPDYANAGRFNAIAAMLMLGRFLATGVLFYMFIRLIKNADLSASNVLTLILLTASKESLVFTIIFRANRPLSDSDRTELERKDTPFSRAMGLFFVLFYSCAAFTLVWDLVVIKWWLKDIVLNIANLCELVLLLGGGWIGTVLFILPLRMGYLLQSLTPGIQKRARVLQWAAFILAVMAVFYPLAKVYDAEDYIARGEKYLAEASDTNDIDDMLDACNKAVKLKPQNAGAITERCIALLIRGYNFDAYADLTNALRKEASGPKIHYALACWHFLMENYGPAEAEFSSAARLSLTNAGFYYVQGRGFFIMQTYGLAARLSLLALRFCPDNAVYLDFQGRCLQKNSKRQKALVYFNRALAMDPTNGGYFHDRGWCYLDMGLYGNAADDFSRLIGMQASGENYYARGVAYYLGGRKKLARADWRAGAKLGDDSCRENLFEYFKEKYADDSQSGGD